MPNEKEYHSIKLCKDFPGECCLSCHEDAAMGLEDVLITVSNKDGKVIAVVCCFKTVAAEREANLWPRD